jgi:hypothetical protein
MTRFVVGYDRSQSTLFPERLDAIPKARETADIDPDIASDPKQQLQNNGAAFFCRKICELFVKRLSGQGNISAGLRFH